MVLPCLRVVGNLETNGDLAEVGRKRKKQKHRHYRPPLCSFTSGGSFSSGGGDRKIRYVKYYFLSRFFVFSHTDLTLAFLSFMFFHIW
jgi:hypothetical protein